MNAICDECGKHLTQEEIENGFDDICKECDTALYADDDGDE